MSFFSSEIVQQEMKEISELQEKIYEKVFAFSTMDKNDKLQHVEMLEELLNKQRVLYTRMTLSDDPAAKEMKESILTQAKQLGFPPDVDLSYVFGNMTHIIDNMKKSLRDS
jgi:GTPase Era involved in 16S rRNA processing